MENFIYDIPTRVYFGRGQIEQLKRREKKGKKEENSQEAPGYMPKPVSDQVGREIDVYG